MIKQNNAERLLGVRKHFRIIIIQKFRISINELYKFGRLSIFYSGLVSFDEIWKGVDGFNTLVPIIAVQISKDRFEFFHKLRVNWFLNGITLLFKGVWSSVETLGNGYGLPCWAFHKGILHIKIGTLGKFSKTITSNGCLLGSTTSILACTSCI